MLGPPCPSRARRVGPGAHGFFFMHELSDKLILGIQRELARGEFSAGQIAKRLGLPRKVVKAIARGKIRTSTQPSVMDARRELERWRDALAEPLGVFEEEAGSPEDEAEAELVLDGAPVRLAAVRRAKLEARRAAREVALRRAQDRDRVTR